MLYDPKWEKPSLAGLIAWLENQPSSRSHDACEPQSCLAGQYYIAIGLKPVVELDAWLADIAFSGQWTLGAALERARKLAAAVTETV